MIIRQFVETFRDCPMCHHRLDIDARHKNTTSDSNILKIHTDNDALIIDVSSPFFVNADNNNFEFAISLFNGNILHCNNTNQFVSLYDLNIILKKECKHCFALSKLNSFSRSMRLYYDRDESAFNAEALIDCFTFRDDVKHYYFCNNFEDGTSLLGINPIGGFDRSKIVKTHYVPFESFDFDNRHSMITKLFAMQML